jgi:cell division protein FtsQ
MRPVELEPQPPELLAEEEPRYLRRQKPLEIKRRRFGRAWRLYSRIFLCLSVAAALGGGGYEAVRFLFFSPQMILASLDQIETAGHHYVPRAAVLEKFAADRGRSVLRIPLERRRRALEEIPWVEQAICQRVLPNRLRVELVERVPVAFLRVGTELSLIDAYGVILERPLQGDFLFPVVTGMDEAMERAGREKRMRLYERFLKEVEQGRAGSSQQVSEVDLSDPSDLRATFAGLPEPGDLPARSQPGPAGFVPNGRAKAGPAVSLRPQAGGQAPYRDGTGQASVLVHFGAGDFLSKFRMFVENIGQWQAAAGRVESVDLRFDRQVVVNPEGPTPVSARNLAGIDKAR